MEWPLPEKTQGTGSERERRCLDSKDEEGDDVEAQYNYTGRHDEMRCFSSIPGDPERRRSNTRADRDAVDEHNAFVQPDHVRERVECDGLGDDTEEEADSKHYSREDSEDDSEDRSRNLRVTSDRGDEAASRSAHSRVESRSFGMSMTRIDLHDLSFT